MLTKTGMFDRGITHDGMARGLTLAEVAELVDLLGIPWPSQKSPQRPARGDKSAVAAGRQATCWICPKEGRRPHSMARLEKVTTVSYTHLTLPTICSV